MLPATHGFAVPRSGSGGFRPHILTRPPSVPSKPSAPAPPPKPVPAPAQHPVPPVPQVPGEPAKKHKELPPLKDPPTSILDRSTGAMYERGAHLGTGGFARVYEVRDEAGKRHAIKVIPKNRLTDVKAKTRLYAEIKIHRAIQHVNVCRFEECFEDADNVYITLELCRNGNLMEFVKKRGKLTEPEVRYYMVQLAGACNYLHTHRIIHRDLKLGNLFLDDKMDLKVGDFGLAALLEKEGDRKTTICGTPNYIAPEVLFHSKIGGHSFEVDVWSVGVIMYTMLIGKPPFQTSKVDDIYKRIKDGKFEFPPQSDISDHAKNLIEKLLAQKPEERPSPAALLSHPFFQYGHIPPSISSKQMLGIPHYSAIDRASAPANLRVLRKRAGIDEVGGIRVRREGILGQAQGNAGGVQHGAKAWEEGERDFQRAVGMGSPISALLKSAKQPLLVGSDRPPPENLMRKLSAQSHKPQTRSQTAKAAGARPPLAAVQEEAVSTRSGGRSSRATTQRGDTENVPPGVAPQQQQQQRAKSSGPRATVTSAAAAASVQAPAHLPTAPTLPNMPGAYDGYKRLQTDAGGEHNAFDETARTLNDAFNAKADGKVFRDPALDRVLPPQATFVQAWVDYCHRYGMGYGLTDGTVGVYYNDGTSALVAPDNEHLEFLELHRLTNSYQPSSRRLSEFPSSPNAGFPPSGLSGLSAQTSAQSKLGTKVKLLRSFRDYIFKELYRKQDYTFVDLERTSGLDFVQKWLRAANVTMFKLSNGAFQFNYSDHTKIILANNGLVVTYVDKTYLLWRYSLSELMAAAVAHPDTQSEDEIKMNQKLLKRLRYCREVLATMQKQNLGKEEGNLQAEGKRAAVKAAVGGMR